MADTTISCPKCGSTKGFNTAGEHRLHCQNCNSTFSRTELNNSTSKENAE